ncbi:putative membrane protein [Lachnellula willkommii]|uniref:Putative membrane protein n=1 Tax=Lachnellula willkommii TaxID=215461 RepID=A0A559MDL8_9HELO|nr:putative membrane protein [Lachnellula willkommii]
MEKVKKCIKKGEEWTEKRVEAIWTNLLTNHLWQRMLKNTLATAIAVTLALIPAVVQVYGKAAYLTPITTVFGHPGRRFGMMAEALVLAISGTLVGVAWSTFGLYLSSLIYSTDKPAAYTIRGVFLVFALMLHGFLRSHTPRLFIFVLLLVIVSVVSLTSTATHVTTMAVTQLLYPILTAAGVLILVNVLVFPEFSSGFLGATTIETLGETVEALRDTGRYFVSIVQEEGGKKDVESLIEEETTAEKSEEEPRAETKISFTATIKKLFQKDKKGKAPSMDKETKTVKLKSLTDSKAKLRAKLASCKAAQMECNFELSWAFLPPRDLKPISDTHMKKLVANTIALIGACESKYALMGDDDDKKETESKAEHQLNGVAEEANIESGNESSHSIESGDIELLKYLVARIAKPLVDLQEKIDRSVDVVTSCLAYCYEVPKLPSGARAPKGIELQEIDIRIDILIEALADFDKNSASALEGAAALHDLDLPQVDIMPRMETFLISSFLLNLRYAAFQTLEMLNHSRVLVEKRQARHGRRRIYLPRINWQKWLASGGEEDMFALPENGKKGARTGKSNKALEDNDDDSATSDESLLTKKDVESVPIKESRSQTPKPAKKAMKSEIVRSKKRPLIDRLRHNLADGIEYLAESEDFFYALKLTIAVFLVTWPAFVYSWNAWYSLNRGLWAALQLVLITEVAIGTSVLTFMLRAVGTTIGCIWGYAAYEAGNGNRVICVVLLVIGIIPSTYIQLGSKYVKAGMVSIISMCIVALATIDHTVPGSATENFLKRWIAFLIGGVVALVVEVVLFPVKARDRLVESLASSISRIIEMEACLAYGVDTEANVDVQAGGVTQRFEHAKGKAEGALTAAETFLPFCAHEPRLKGSFEGLALVYAEILYVLHAIIDRMDNMVHLRHEYGSGVLEELNAQVFAYRRNVAGSITLILFAVHEALTTKLPLPQFLPSARLAHLRMVNRVREVVVANDAQNTMRSEIEMSMIKRVVRQKFQSWNAASAGQIEVIEYLEELVDLTKLLVGANEFRSGLLTRPTYREYIERVERDNDFDGLDGAVDSALERNSQADEDEERDVMPEPENENRVPPKKRMGTLSKNTDSEMSEARQFEKQKQANEEELPRSLQRVRSRRLSEAKLQKTKSLNEDTKGKRVDRGGNSTAI